MRAFNLLRYPVWASQRQRRDQQGSLLAGLAAGVAVAWFASQWAQQSAAQVQRERNLLQAQLADHQAQWQSLQQRQAMQKKWQSQAAHLAHLTQQHAAWQAVHQALQKESGPDSVQFLRLQLEANSLEMHGSAPNAQRMDRAQQAFSSALTQHLQPVLVLNNWVVKPATTSSAGALVALQAASQQGLSPPTSDDALEFVWQSGWPARRVAPRPDSPVQAGPANGQAQP